MWTAFKRRLIENGKGSVFEEMLVEIVKIAQEQGVKFGAIQIMDSVHTEANVNTAKEGQRRKGGKRPRDGGAPWGVKGKKRVNDQQGRRKEAPRYFYGYKAHVSLNAEAEMITSVVVTPGNGYDGHMLPKLVEKDLAVGAPVETVAADRGYDDGENHYLLESLGLRSAICLNWYRTQKKDKNKQVWLELKATPEYQAGQREWYKIERKFGEAKENHGLRRCRYVGYVRYLIQACLTAMVLKLKRMVKLLTGVPFKGRARAPA